MNKEFVPYEITLELKELGFDEPCLGHYNSRTGTEKVNVDYEIGGGTISNSNFSRKLDDNHWRYAAPLYQQAFRWFRKKHELYGTLSKSSYMIEGHVNGEFLRVTKLFLKSYEEAELACLKQLIEIVKEANT